MDHPDAKKDAYARKFEEDLASNNSMRKNSSTSQLVNVGSTVIPFGPRKSFAKNSLTTGGVKQPQKIVNRIKVLKINLNFSR